MTTKSNPEPTNEQTRPEDRNQRAGDGNRSAGAHTGEVGENNPAIPEWQNDPNLEERMEVDRQADEDALTEDLPQGRHQTSTKSQDKDQDKDQEQERAAREREQRQQADAAPQKKS
jgi:hypothetical protein